MKRVLCNPKDISKNAPMAGDRGFDPEGGDYDYSTAKARGMKPGDDGHWSSRDGETGMLLKGRAHPTFNKGVEIDKAMGYELVKKGGRYYTLKGGKP